MPEILRVDDGRRQRVRGVDVLTNHVNKLKSETSSSLTTEPRVNGCCNRYVKIKSDKMERQGYQVVVPTKWNTIGVA